MFISYPERYRPQISITLKVTALCCAAAIIIGSFAALYIGVPYLQLGGETIKGVQVRYFYPAFFILAAIPLTHRVRTSKSTIVGVVLIGSIICLSSLILINAIKYQWLHF